MVVVGGVKMRLIETPRGGAAGVRPPAVWWTAESLLGFAIAVAWRVAVLQVVGDKEGHLRVVRIESCVAVSWSGCGCMWGGYL